MLTTDVLISGAGPVGLTLANILARNNINFIIIDKQNTWSDKSKAMTITPRTLELLHTIDIAPKLVEVGIPAYFINYYYSTFFLGRANFKELESQYNIILQVPQSKTTQLLNDKLENDGFHVCWNHELVAFHRLEGEILCDVKNHENGSHLKIRAKYLVACDGGRSTVRELDGIEFNGEEYEETFLMADICMKNFLYAFEERHLFYLPKKSFFYVMPIESDAINPVYRIITTTKYKKNYSDQEVIDMFNQILNNIKIHNVRLYNPRWISQFNPKQFLVSNFYCDRVIYMGDAAHIQSPIGSQGLNTGLQDAFNAAWRLTFILKYGFEENILSSYHEERHRIALNLFKFNNQISNVIFGYSKFFRRFFIAQKIMHCLKRFNHKEIQAISQLRIAYPQRQDNSPQNSFLCAGKRLPHFKIENFQSIYDLILTDKMMLLIFSKNSTADEFLGNLAVLPEHVYVVIIFKEKSSTPFNLNYTYIHDYDEKIHKKMEVQDSIVCLIRPDTYISAVFNKNQELIF